MEPNKNWRSAATFGAPLVVAERVHPLIPERNFSAALERPQGLPEMIDAANGKALPKVSVEIEIYRIAEDKDKARAARKHSARVL